ncbi:hypothetical protein D3C85_861690 [compost metagenome]
MKQYNIAAILMIVHGGLMELSVCLALAPLLILGVSANESSHYFSFAVPYFQDNLYLMMAMSGIFGITRIIGAIGLLKNRMWGLALSIINCVVTMILMVFMLPAGIVDGLFACAALILILVAYFGDQRIIKQ